jgi:polysaccharide biosynthesis protein VpsM
MKNTVRKLALLGCSITPVFAAPFLAIGDNAELFLTGTASIRYDDNILLQDSGASKLDDTIFEFAPGFQLKYGKDSLLSGALTFSEVFSAYSTNEELNEELANASFTSKYDNGKAKLGFNTSYNQLYQNTVDVTGVGLSRRDVFAIGLNGEFEVSEKTSVGSGVSYDKTEYLTKGFIDTESYTIPANFYYELTPKIDLSTGIRYRNTSVDAVKADSEDYYFNVGARGEFTPKLLGSFSIGYNERKSDAANADSSGLGLNTGLTYVYSEKTQFGLDASRDFGTGSGGDSQENTRVGLTVTTDIAADWKANAGLSYRMIDYTATNRSDDYYEANIGATYIVNSMVSLNGGYVYRENSSSVVGGDFSNNVVSLSVSARY